MVAQKRRKKSFSYVLYVLYVLLLLVIIGDIIGASLYVKLEQSSQSLMANYVNENVNVFNQESWSFNQLFYKQFMYQGSMWVLGLTGVGVIVNLFLVFLKGVIAGFNVFFIFQALSPFQAILTSLLWLIQYLLILGVTILSGYFSVRFVIMAVKILFFKKKKLLLKKHLLYYFYQLVIITVLTLLTAGVTYLIQPVVYQQFEKAGKSETIQQSADDFISTSSDATSHLNKQININFEREVL